MNARKIYMALIAVVILTAQTVIAGPQQGQAIKGSRGGWGSVSRAAQSDRYAQDNDSTTEADAVTAHVVDPKKRLVGTWVITVPDAPGAPGFSALHTYTEDGTMTETSSLLGQLAEGPAHGVWEGKKSDYAVTFELFAFDPSGQTVGRIRVRARIRIVNDDNLTADTAVDFIELDGTVVPDIGSGPFSGKRVKIN